jgi:hypothetical protein
MEESAEEKSTFIAWRAKFKQNYILVEHGLQSENGDASIGQKKQQPNSQKLLLNSSKT